MVGTRPEAIKLAPVAEALAARGLPPRLLFTGQHPLDPSEHGLARFERVMLDCPGKRDPLAHSDAVAKAIAPLLSEAPHLVVVQGDTSSALGGAIAGFTENVPVAHVEAGLRSFDAAMPWPEEQNRIAIDRLSSLLFAPTATSAANLRFDGAPGTVVVTGNTGIDALFKMLGELGPVEARRPSDRLRLLVTCHRRENWGRPMRSVAAALNQLAQSEPVEIQIVLHTNPVVADAMRRAIAPNPHVELLAPLLHSEMIAAMRSADLLLSDSGGVQEEAPALGVPLLVLREKTERPEGIASGNTALVGTARERIVAGVKRLFDPAVRTAMSRPSLPFGDGHSGPRIAEAMLAWIERQEPGLRRAG